MPLAATAHRDPLLLPEGVRLVHIGPHKTGTTALQAALWTARPALLDQGVRHAGRNRNAAAAASAVIGRRSHFIGGAVPPIGRWHELVREVAKAREPRVVVSSEVFADAPPEAIRTIVDDLGPSLVHVAITLRPLDRILPSQWQQYVQNGITASFETWLDAMFNRPDTRLTPTFWHRHRHDRLVERWAEAVGPANVTVIAIDEHDRAMVLRAFERLSGLREGTLASPHDLANRSLTLPEIEAVRAFNAAFKAEGLDRALLSQVMSFGAAQHLKRHEPEPGAPRVEVPQWAVDRAAEVAREMVAAIAASGVRVVGDLASLARTAPGRVDEPGPVGVPPGVAASLSMGILIASGRARGARVDAAAEVERLPTYVLAGVWFERVRSSVIRRWNRALRRVP